MTSIEPCESLIRGYITGRSLRFLRASEVRPRSSRWLWEDRIPEGHVSVLGGPTGLGKSTLACGLVAQATKGKLVGDLEGVSLDVAMLSAEDDPETTIIPRLAAARADLRRVVLPRFDDGGLPGLPSDGAALVAGLSDEGIRLLVIDPGPSFLDSTISSNNEQDVRAALAPLVDAGRDQGLTTLLLLHVTTKPTKATGLGRMLGSTAWAAFPRSVLLLEAADPDDETNPDRVLHHLKSNLGPRQGPLAVRIEPVYDELADEQGRPIRTSRAVLLGPVSEAASVRVAPVRDSTKLSWATRRVLEAVPDHPISLREIADRVAKQGSPFRHKTILASLEELVHLGLVDETGEGDDRVWRRTEQGTQLREVQGVLG